RPRTESGGAVPLSPAGPDVDCSRYHPVAFLVRLEDAPTPVRARPAPGGQKRRRGALGSDRLLLPSERLSRRADEVVRAFRDVHTEQATSQAGRDLEVDFGARIADL